MAAFEDAVAKEVGRMVLRYAGRIDVADLARRVDGDNRRAIEEIRAALDQGLGDGERDDFMCVEQIIRILEELGTDGGCRHDF